MDNEGKKIMLLSLLLILFLSIGMVAATNDISTDDAASTDAGLAIDDADSATEDANLDVSSVSEETMGIDADKSPLQADGNEKKNSTFGYYGPKGTVNDYCYDVIYLEDEDEKSIPALIDVSVNEVVTTINYTTPFEHKIENLQYGLNYISYIYNGSETYNPCRADFTIYRADYFPSFDINAPDVYYGDDANITIKLLDKDENVLAESFSARIESYDQNGTLLFNKTYELSNGEGNIIIPASELISGRPFDIRVEFIGNDLYAYDYDYHTFYVISPDVIFDAIDRYYWLYDYDFDYDFILTDSADNLVKGYVDVYINGRYFTSVKVGDEYGASVTLNGLNEGLNKVRLVFNGTDFYNPATKLVNVILCPETVGIRCNLPQYTRALTGDIVNITASLFSYDSASTPNVDFDVTINCYDGDIELKDTQTFVIHNGTGTIMLDTSDLEPGTYEVYIHYNGSTRYCPATYNPYDEWGDRYTPSILVQDRIPASLYVNHDDTSTEDSMLFEFYLEDDWSYDPETGEYAKVGNETIYVYLNDALFGQYKTSSAEPISVNVSGLKIGDNEFVFLFNGSDLYEYTQSSCLVSYYPVQSQIELEGLTDYYTYGKNVTFNAKLIDINSEELIDAEFEISLYDEGDYYNEEPMVIYQRNITKAGLVNIDSSLFERGKYYIINAIYESNGTVSPVNRTVEIYIEDDRKQVWIYNTIRDIRIGDDFVFKVVLYEEIETEEDYELSYLNDTVTVSIYLEDDMWEGKGPIYNGTVRSNENVTVDGSLFENALYCIKSVYEGTDVYRRAWVEDNFFVSSTPKTDVIVEAPGTVEYRDDARINVTLVDSNGDKIEGLLHYEVYVGDDWEFYSFEGNVTSGGFFILPGDSLMQDTSYHVQAYYTGDGHEILSSGSDNFYVNEATKGILSIDIDVPKTPLGEDVSIGLSMYDNDGNVDGSLALSFYTKNPDYYDIDPFYTTTASAGSTISVSGDKFDEGIYYVMASFAENDDYYGQNATKPFVVSDRNPSSMWLDIYDLSRGESSYYTANLYNQDYEDLYLNVTVEFYTEEAYEAGEEPFHSNTFISGQPVSVDTSYFEPGVRYVARASFEGNDEYMPSSTGDAFTAKPDPRGTILIKTDLPSVVYDDSVSFTVHMTDRWDDPYAADLEVYLNGEFVGNFTILEDGTEISLDDLAFGPNKVEFKFAGNYYYLPASENVNVLYASKPVTIDMDASDDGVIIIIKDIDGIALSNTAIKVTVNGEESEKTTGADGTISVPVSGNATVKAVYTDENGLATTSSIKVVEKIKEVEVPVEVQVEVPVEVPTVANASLDVSVEEDSVIITVKDLDGKAIGGANLTVIVDGVESNVTAGADGTVSVPVSGSAAVTVSYADALGSIASSSVKVVEKTKEVTVPSTPERKATVIVYENMSTTAVGPTDGRTGEYFYFTLTDANGKPIPNTPMQIGFNGKVYDYEHNNISTDEKGVAKLQINLGYKGDYTFAICFLGNDDYNASFAVAVIKVDVQKPKLTAPNKSYAASAKTKTLTATFKTDKGNPIVGKSIKFTVNGKTYSAKTNDKGVATVKVSLNKKGTYNFTVKYGGDSTYAAVTQKAKLTIK